MKISACWIAKNEEKDIARSINSVKDAVDEMIVVDTGSTDGTAKVAKKLGARVEHFTWIDDFAAARNYALSFATGAVIIFLDADEWFEPALSKEMAREIIHEFEEYPQALALNVVFYNIDQGSGIVQEKLELLRIFRNMPELKYEGSIHEALAMPGHATIFLRTMPLKVYHTGYSIEKSLQKIHRNIEMMEEAAKQEGLEIEELTRLHLYLQREYFNAGMFEESFGSVNALLALPNVFKIIARFPVMNGTFYFKSMELCARLRSRVSRKDLPFKLLRQMERTMPDDPVAELLSYYYEHFFEIREGEFLKRVRENLATGGVKAEARSDFYNRTLSRIYEWAAQAAWRRADVAGAFDFASFSFLHGMDVFNSAALSILLASMRGQPAADQILLLDKLVGVGNERKMKWLMDTLRDGDNVDLYLYFFKRTVDSGWATRRDLFYVRLLTGKYAELLLNLVDNKEVGDKQLLADIFLMLRLCAPDLDGLAENMDIAGGNKRVYEACANGGALKKPTEDEIGILYRCYALVYKADAGAAETLWDAFSERPDAQYLCKASFLQRIGRYAEAADMELGALADNAGCLARAISTDVLTGRYAETITLCRYAVEREIVTGGMLADLSAVAEVAGGETGRQAKELYEQAIYFMEEYIDVVDVIHTGFIPTEADSKKKTKALAAMTLQQLEQAIAGDAYPMRAERYISAMRGGVAVYEEKGAYIGAAHYWQRLATAEEGRREAYEGMARCFEKLGNKNLARRLQRFDK